MEKEFLFEIARSISVVVALVPFIFAEVDHNNKDAKLVDYCFTYLMKYGVPLFVIIHFGIPLVKDLPYIISGDYCYIEGMVLEKKGDSRTVEMVDKEFTEIVEINVRNARMPVGSRGIVKYLPNEKIGVVVDEIKEISESRREEEREMEKIALMESLIFVLMIGTLLTGMQKKKWMAYLEIGLYKRMMLIMGACMLGIIVMCMRSDEVPVKWSTYMTTLVVLLFLSGMVIQRMGIKKKENTLIVVPIVGKNREIPEQKINQFVSDRTDMIEIMDGEKVILCVSDQFHGYEELKDILRKNAGEI